ncbi:hypothetical protein PFISCL1PPCAC_5006, partial [Pristionchus fissidentatus]
LTLSIIIDISSRRVVRRLGMCFLPFWMLLLQYFSHPNPSEDLRVNPMHFLHGVIISENIGESRNQAIEDGRDRETRFLGCSPTDLPYGWNKNDTHSSFFGPAIVNSPDSLAPPIV